MISVARGATLCNGSGSANGADENARYVVSLVSLIPAAVIFLAAGLIQGLTGFGFAIVAMAALPLFVGDFQTVFTLVALTSIVIPFLVFAQHHQGFKIKPALALALGGLAGTWLGFHFMDRNAGGLYFVRLFGAVLVLIAIADYLLTSAFRLSMPKAFGFPSGFLGGFFAGAFNIGGPPMVAFAYSQPWSKQQIVTALQFAFTLSTGYRLVLMLSNGYFSSGQGLDWSLLKTTGILFLPTAVGVFVGGKLLHKIDKDHLRQFVLVAVGLLGIKYLLFPG